MGNWNYSEKITCHMGMKTLDAAITGRARQMKKSAQSTGVLVNIEKFWHNTKIVPLTQTQWATQIILTKSAAAWT
jgi:hypothetical protein